MDIVRIARLRRLLAKGSKTKISRQSIYNMQADGRLPEPTHTTCVCGRQLVGWTPEQVTVILQSEGAL